MFSFLLLLPNPFTACNCTILNTLKIVCLSSFQPFEIKHTPKTGTMCYTSLEGHIHAVQCNLARHIA